MADDRIDTRFPRLRFPRRDSLLRSILLHLLHHTGTVCVRTFSSFYSPLRFHPYSGHFSDSVATLDIARLLYQPQRLRGNSPTHPRWSAFRGHVISTDCMQLSKPSPPASTTLSKVLWFSDTTQ